MIWYINPRRKPRRKARTRRRAAPRRTSFSSRAVSAVRRAAPHVGAAARWAGRSALSGARKAREAWRDRSQRSAYRRATSYATRPGGFARTPSAYAAATSTYAPRATARAMYSRKNPGFVKRSRRARTGEASIRSMTQGAPVVYRRKRRKLAGAALAAWRKKRGLSASSNPSRRKRTMAKSRKRSAAARKAARTRALKKARRSAAAKKGARKRRRFGTRTVRGFSRRAIRSMYGGKRARPRRGRKAIRAYALSKYKPNPRRRRRRRRNPFSYAQTLFSNPRRRRRRRRASAPRRRRLRRNSYFGMLSPNPRRRRRKSGRRAAPRRRRRYRRNTWFGAPRRHRRAARKGWSRRRRRSSAGRRLRKGSRKAARYLARSRYKLRRNPSFRMKGMLGSVVKGAKAAIPVVISWGVGRFGASMIAGLPGINSLGRHANPVAAAAMFLVGGMASRTRFTPNLVKKYALNPIGLGVALVESLIRTYAPASVKGFLGVGEYFETRGVGEYFETRGVGEYFETQGAVEELAATEDLALGAYSDSMAPGMDEMVGFQPTSRMLPARAFSAPVETVDQEMLDDALYTGVFRDGQYSGWDF